MQSVPWPFLHPSPRCFLFFFNIPSFHTIKTARGKIVHRVPYAGVQSSILSNISTAYHPICTTSAPAVMQGKPIQMLIYFDQIRPALYFCTGVFVEICFFGGPFFLEQSLSLVEQFLDDQPEKTSDNRRGSFRYRISRSSTLVFSWGI